MTLTRKNFSISILLSFLSSTLYSYHRGFIVLFLAAIVLPYFKDILGKMNYLLYVAGCIAAFAWGVSLRVFFWNAMGYYQMQFVDLYFIVWMTIVSCFTLLFSAYHLLKNAH